MIASRAGLIVNVASAASFACSSRMSAYNASKAAVVALSETLFQELAQHRVHVAVARDIIIKAAANATHIVLPASYRWLWRFKRFAPRSFLRWLADIRQRRHSNGG